MVTIAIGISDAIINEMSKITITIILICYFFSVSGKNMILKKIQFYFNNSNNIISFIIVSTSKTIYKLFLPVFNTMIAKVAKTKKNRLVFISSPDYSDNGKVLSDYIINDNKINYEIIWLVNKPELYKDLQTTNKVKFIKGRGKYHNYLTLKAIYYANTANIVFCTHGFAKIKKKKNNLPLIVNLWHGCGYKDSVNKKVDKDCFDYVLVPGRLFVDTKCKFFDCTSEKILDIGYPRYDLLKTKSESAEEFISRIINKLSVDNIIIWMPTFRKAHYYVPESDINIDFDLPIVASIQNMYILNDYCKKNRILIIIKKHKNQVGYKAQKIDFSNIKFLTNENLDSEGVQLYELLPLTNALITDYSSIAIDYLLLDKPIGFTLDDYEQYKETRGFVFKNPLDYMPGHHMYTLDDLYNFIDDLIHGKDNYKHLREKVKKVTHNPTENYCERIVEYFKLMKKINTSC